MTFSKKVMTFACVIIGVIIILCVYDYVFNSNTEILETLLTYSKWLFGACFGMYCAKSGVENKAKIDNAHIEKLNKIKEHM